MALIKSLLSFLLLILCGLLIREIEAFQAAFPARSKPVRAIHHSGPLHEQSISSTTSDFSPNGVVKNLEPDQLNFLMGYMNQNHADLLKSFAQCFSPLGSEMAKSNAFSKGTFVMESVTITDINTEIITLAVVVNRRGKPQTTEVVEFSLDADPVPERARRYNNLPPVPKDENRLAIDDIVRRLNRLCWIVSASKVTGKLIQLATQLSGNGVGKLPENMYLNQVPHNRYVRQYFYDKAADAVLAAVILCSQKKISNRMKIISQFPEMNPSMDSYRIGTILEMARGICIRLAEQNVRVRLCVQGSMGVGKYRIQPMEILLSLQTPRSSSHLSI